MTLGKAVGLLLFGLVLPLPAFAQAGAGNARAEIEKVDKAWEKAYNAGDAAAVAALYAPDAKLLAPGSEPGTDPKAIEKIIAAGIAAGGKLTLTAEDLVGFGDYAAESGKWVANSTDGKHLDHGSFLAVYKKTKGGWKLYRDTWNSSMSNK
jgi:uncharacterized protein (TIGR02246 family)